MVYVVLLLSVVIIFLCYMLYYAVYRYEGAFNGLVEIFEEEYNEAVTRLRKQDDDLFAKLDYRELVVWESVISKTDKFLTEYFE